LTQKSATAWHKIPTDEALAALETRAEGLPTDETEIRQKHYGPNTIKSGRETSARNILLHQIANPLVYVLLAAIVVTVTIQHRADAIVIGIVVVLNTVIGLVQEYRAENAMQALIQMSAPKARVRRENHEANIASSGAVHFRLRSQTNYHKNVMEMLFLCIFILCLCY